MCGRVRAVVAAMLVLAGCGDADRPACPDGGACEGDAAGMGFADAGVGGDTGAVLSSDAGPAGPAWIPFIDGAFQRVYRPSGTRYLNDHTLLRDPSGRWHVYGITHESTGNPQAEVNLLHATAPALGGPWRDEANVLMSQSKGALWAPFAFQSEPGHWVMYYYATGIAQRVQRADSTDPALTAWARVPERWAPGGRDPFVMRAGELWYLYTVGIDAASHGTIAVSTSPDLVTWTEPATVLTDPELHLGWGNLESPTVVVRDDGYYLFLTRTTAAPMDYGRTMVFHSRDPRRFTWTPVTELITHAAEVFEADGQSYITAGGWTSMVGENGRGLSIAKLGWVRRPAD